MSQDVALARPATVPMESVMGAVNAFEIWENSDLFGQMQKAAVVLSKTQVIPKHFQNKPDDCFIGLAIARATQQDPIMVMQSLYVADGRAGWYSKYLISRANMSGIFMDPIVFEDGVDGTVTFAGKERPNIWVEAIAVLSRTGREVRQKVDLKTAVADGWTRNAKYQSIPKRMLEWRSASWLINLYAPHILFGLPTAEEIQDVHYEVIDPMETVAAGGGRPQISDFQPQEGAGGQAAPAAASGGRGRRRGAQAAPSAPASPPPPPVEAETAEQPAEPSGTIGGAQITNDEPGEEPLHVITIILAGGGEQMFKIPAGQDTLDAEWKKQVASLKGAGYSAVEKFWNANAGEMTRLSNAGHKGLAEHLQNIASAAASAEKKADKAKAAQAEADAKAAAEAEAQHQGDPTEAPSGGAKESSGGSGEESSEGEPDPLMFVTDDGEVHEFDTDEDAEKWLHDQITSFGSVDDLAGFYEANQKLMDELGFGVVVDKQLKALAAPKATTPTAVTGGKKFHPAVKPIDPPPNNDFKVSFTAITKVLDELRDNGGKAEDYAELARINEALIGQVKVSLAQWFKTLEKRFKAQGVTV